MFTSHGIHSLHAEHRVPETGIYIYQVLIIVVGTTPISDQCSSPQASAWRMHTYGVVHARCDAYVLANNRGRGKIFVAAGVSLAAGTRLMTMIGAAKAAPQRKITDISLFAWLIQC